MLPSLLWRIRYGGAFLALAIVFSAAAAIIQRAGNAERDFLERELAPFLVPSVSFKGRTYEIHRGEIIAPAAGEVSIFTAVRVLRLARYAVITRTDPIFGLSGVDTRRLAAGVSKLNETLEDIASMQPREADRAQLTALHPIVFLRMLPELEELRRMVVADPDSGTVRRYQEQLEEVIAIAVVEAMRLRESIILTRTAATGVRPGIFYLRSSTDEETVLHALDELAAGFRRLGEKARERGRCLSSWMRCRAALAYVPPPQAAFGDAPSARIDPVTAGLLTELWQQRGFDVSPRTYWIRTPCFGKADLLQPFQLSWRSPSVPERLFPEWESLGLGRIVDASPLSSLYFFPLDRLKDTAHLAPLVVKHYDVFWQAAGNYYTCPDLSYLARLTSLDIFVGALAEQPLFRIVALPTDDTFAPVLRELARRERELVASSSVTEDEVFSFARRIAGLLGTSGESDLAGVIGEEIVLRAGELVRRVFQGSAALDDFVATGAVRNYWLRRFAVAAPAGHTPAAMLLVNSHPSLYFLPFNPSFRGDAPPPRFANASGGNPAFIELDALRRRYTLRDIASIMDLTLLQSFYPPQAGRP